jgi:hypothetical protein
MGTLPGVKDLPVGKAMPNVMVMNDGTRVQTNKQWAKRPGCGGVICGAEPQVFERGYATLVFNPND